MNGNLLCRDAVIRRTLVCLRYLYRRSLSLSLSVVSSVVSLSADVEGPGIPGWRCGWKREVVGSGVSRGSRCPLVGGLDASLPGIKCIVFSFLPLNPPSHPRPYSPPIFEGLDKRGREGGGPDNARGTDGRPDERRPAGEVASRAAGSREVPALALESGRWDSGNRKVCPLPAYAHLVGLDIGHID